MLIPQAALLTDQQGLYVFVVVDGHAAIRRLKTGADDAGVKLNETSTGALVDMQHAMVNLGQTTEGLTIAAFKPFIGVVTGASDILTGLDALVADGSGVREAGFERNVRP